MKYTVYAIKNEKVTLHAIALTNNKEYEGYKVVAQTRTKAEAKKIVDELGWIVNN